MIDVIVPQLTEMSLESIIQIIMAREVIPGNLFQTMLNQAEELLGKKPRVTMVTDQVVKTRCQGGETINIHVSAIDYKDQEANTSAAWIYGHDILPDGIQLKSSEKPINSARLGQTVVDTACAAVGCSNGANCALKRNHLPETIPV